jgi:hypothetical protein
LASADEQIDVSALSPNVGNAPEQTPADAGAIEALKTPAKRIR